MPTRASSRRAASPSVRALLAERLRERMSEIERAAFTRLQGVSNAPERPDVDYAEGLRSATSAALEYLLAGVERGEAEPAHPPPAVLIQARLAARNRVGLDTVLRRCFAGHSLFNDFLMEELPCLEAAEPDLPKRLLREQAALLDRMIAAVSEEHTREAARRSTATDKRRARLVERLLAGEPLDAVELNYELDAHHLAIIAKGPGAADSVGQLASTLRRRLLVIPSDDELLWAWLGGRDPLDPVEVLCRISADRPPELRIALGEPGEGAEGWRLSHRQAAAALPVAQRGKDPVTCYGDVALLAAALADELLATFLRKTYLDRLDRARDGGAVLRETLSAYFATEFNVSSTAAQLGVRRETVANRLRAVERLLGRPLGDCTVELVCALHLHERTGQVPCSDR